MRRSWEWHVSALAGLLLTGQWRPLCSIIWDLPLPPVRRVYCRQMDRSFDESEHCVRIHVEWMLTVIR